MHDTQIHSMNSIEQLKAKTEQFSRVLDEFPEIRYLGDPVLRTPAEQVELEEGIEIGNKLGSILVRYRNMVGYGRGLAAPQIGLSKAVFVTYLNDQMQIYTNPKIIESSQKQNLYRELCLSSGLMWADVRRSATITMQWTDSKGQNQHQEATDTLARLWLHEEAHLRGIPNLDQAEPGTIEFALSDPLKEKIRLS